MIDLSPAFVRKSRSNTDSTSDVQGRTARAGSVGPIGSKGRTTLAARSAALFPTYRLRSQVVL